MCFVHCLKVSVETILLLLMVVLTLQGIVVMNNSGRVGAKYIGIFYLYLSTISTGILMYLHLSSFTFISLSTCTLTMMIYLMYLLKYSMCFIKWGMLLSHVTIVGEFLSILVLSAPVERLFSVAENSKVFTPSDMQTEGQTIGTT